MMNGGSIFKKMMPAGIKDGLRRAFFGADNFRISFAQSGEDISVLASLISIFGSRKGFYVDVGAFHPTIGSNTHLFYNSGWSGINIDPRPGSMKLFNKVRPRDINIEVGVGSKHEVLKYYFISDDSTMNSFSEQALIDNGVRDQVQRIIEIQVLPLSEILNQHVPKDSKVDFLNIDTEGFEIEVLSSIDWVKHTPSIIAIEQNHIFSLEDVINSETCRFLTEHSYSPVGKNMITDSVSTIIYAHKLP